MTMTATIDGPSAKLKTTVSGTGWRWDSHGMKLLDHLQRFTFSVWNTPLSHRRTDTLHRGAPPDPAVWPPDTTYRLDDWLPVR